MNELEQILSERKEKLISNIQTLSEQKINALECINHCFHFIESNILRTENDIKTVPDFFLKSIRAKGGLRNASGDDIKKYNIISMQSLAYEASEFIHGEFGKLNEPNYLMDEFGKKKDEYDGFFIQDKENLKLFTFIYHQFFITIISTLDDYFSQLLLLILQAYPEKLGDTKIFQVKFKDVNNLLETGIDKIIIKSMNEQIFSHVRNSMGQKPLAYLTELVKYLGDPKLIRLERLTYCEMCLRRKRVFEKLEAG